MTKRAGVAGSAARAFVQAARHFLRVGIQEVAVRKLFPLVTMFPLVKPGSVERKTLN